ncbi:hypothetical protein AGDE_12734 [Angomonas deanei]|uniref:REH2 DRSM domain-containing protein n=1 Tax=Angomonas deanei TaxID=59799 RepID=A0A7G2C763_9TRYP|nr:hypothetical protein AGDE_12734 [Angomonas deanei]CAD2214881.1 hypothetical protein, conserved [Angomonas deanei]|eukprot:EPY23611.1 hypothetical protein AGDE_12734 [Angomonas deanei]
MVDAIASGTELMGEAVFSPRKLDRDAQKRVGQYLNDLGRRFEDVFTLSNSEGSTSHKDTFTCAAALPLPAQFGQRMAVGVAPSMTEAMQLAAMHAELILDTLGVRLFQSDEKQEMHARNCAKVGRFAPLPKEGTSVPPDTPSPPPLKMHASQKRKVKRLSPIKEAVKKEENDDDEEVDTEAGVEETPAVPAVPEVRHVSVSESEVDTLCKNRVSYYLARQKKKQPDSFTDEVCFEVTMGKGMVLHRCILSIPLPDKTVREAEGFANTKKDAEVMAWMHAERVLDTLNIPLFDNLPGLQRYHSERVRKLGRSAPAIIQAKQKTITEDPLYPLHLEYSPTTAALPKPVCPSPNDAEDDAKWDKYVQDCIEYIQYKKYVDSNLFFDIERVPRTGDRVIDAHCSKRKAHLPSRT